MSWNPALDLFREVRDAFAGRFGEAELWRYDPSSGETCLSHWTSRLGDPAYGSMVSPLILNEHDGMLLMRYGRYSDLFRGDGATGYMDFWEAHGGLYMECRSVVVDARRGELALTPFRKFRNVNECPETSEDRVAELVARASTVELTEKLDGSMQSARWYGGHVLMAGSMAVDPARSPRLRDGRRMLDANPGYTRLLRSHPCHTAVFEYISPSDPHVVAYPPERTGLYLVGMRDVRDGSEMSYAEIGELAREHGIPTAGTSSLTFAEAMSSLGDRTCDEAEGFVLNVDGFRVKIKYDDYVTMQRTLMSLASPRSVIRAMADGGWDDLVSKIPPGQRDRVASTAARVAEFRDRKSAAIGEWLGRLRESGPADRREAMTWVTGNVPRPLQAGVRNLYLGRPYDVLRPKGRYVRMSEVDGFLDGETGD